MNWFGLARAVLKTSFVPHQAGAAADSARRCLVESLETRQLLAVACGLEPATAEPFSSDALVAGESHSLQLLAAKGNKPVTPKKPAARAQSSFKVRVTWKEARGASKYQVYRREAGSKRWTLAKKLDGDATKYVDRKLEPATTYEYRLRSMGDSGKSRFTKVVSATTKRKKADKPDRPPKPTPDGDLKLVWTEAAPAPVGRHEAIGIAAQGKLYAFGGFTSSLDQRSDAYSYDPKTDRWQRLADLPEPMSHGSAAVDGDRIYVAGFFEGEDHFGDGSRNVWVYDISDNIWSAGPRLPKPQGAGVLVKVGRNLYFFGGLEPGRVANSKEHWVWDLDGGRKWTRAASMPNPRDHLAAVELGGKIYAIGGEHLGNDIDFNQSDVHVYDPKTDRWKQLASLPIPWSHHTSSTVVVNGRIVVIAGETNGRLHLRRVVQYDPAKDQWTELNGVPSTRKSPIAGVVGDVIVVHGGEGRGPEATTWIARIG